MEKHYLIKSKIDVPRTKKSAKILKGLIFCIIAFAALIGFNLLTGESNHEMLRLLLLATVLYVYYKNRTEDKEGTVFASVEAVLKEDEIILDYSDIDRRDGMGTRNEVTTFNYEQIYGLEYSTKLMCLRIAGRPRIQVQFENQIKYPGTRVLANGEDTKMHFLYLDSVNAAEFAEVLGNLANINIDYKEQFSSGSLS